MLSLTLYQINNRDFIGAMSQLVRTPKLEEKTAYRISRIFKACQNAAEVMRKKECELIKTGGFGIVVLADEKTGEVKEYELDEDKHPKVNPLKQDAFLQAWTEMGKASTVEIKVMPLDYKHLAAAGLAPGVLIALEPIMTGFPDDETGDFEVKAVG